MLTLKRTWYQDMRVVFVSCVSISLLITACTLLFINDESPLVILVELFKFWSNITLFFGISYPIDVLKRMSPKKGNTFDAPNMTSLLPFSKKQLLWRGIKPWLIAFPIYVLINTYLLAFIRTQVAANYESVQYIMGGMLYSGVYILFVGTFILQVMGGVMLTFAKSYRGLRVIISLVLLNLFMFFIIGSMVIDLFNIDVLTNISWMIVYFILFLGLGIGVFLKGFKHIEEIYQ